MVEFDMPGECVIQDKTAARSRKGTMIDVHTLADPSQAPPLRVARCALCGVHCAFKAARFIWGPCTSSAGNTLYVLLLLLLLFHPTGHAASWCTGYPEICPSASCTQPLNVANNKTFDVITGLLMEMTGQ